MRAFFGENTFPELKKRYIDTGKVRFIFREFPLDALAAAGFMLARCAGNDKYMPVVETLFAKQRDWMVKEPLPPLKEIAKQFGFTEDSFNACLANQKVLDGIQAVRDHAVDKLGVNSTPTFFINGKKFIGDLSIGPDGQGDRPLSQGRIRVFRSRPAPGDDALFASWPAVGPRNVWITRRPLVALGLRDDSFSAPMRHLLPRRTAKRLSA